MSHFESVTSVGPGFEETGCTPFGASGEPHRFAASGSNAPRRWGIYHDIWQCPTALVPIKVDGRGSAFVIVRPIHSERAMTATPAELPEALVAELRQQCSPSAASAASPSM